MKRPPVPPPWILIFGILSVSCGDPTGAERRLVPALIEGFDDGDPQVTLTVQGSALTVEVTTYGNACREKGETRIGVSDTSRTVSISPFDWVLSRRVCADILVRMEHTATIDLDAAGPWTVVLSGEDISRAPVEFTYGLDL